MFIKTEILCTWYKYRQTEMQLSDWLQNKWHDICLRYLFVKGVEHHAQQSGNADHADCLSCTYTHFRITLIL